LGDHCQITQKLYEFNETFKHFIMLSMLQIFFMCVTLLYGMIKFGFESSFNLLLFSANAVQFFTRFTLYGNVGAKAGDLQISLTPEKVR
jgi:hypothetical protein